MITFIYPVLMAGIVLFTFVQIRKTRAAVKQRKDTEIFTLNRSLMSIAFGIIWLTLFLIFSALFAHQVFRLLNGLYVESWVQLLNPVYLNSLRDYYYDNSMLAELSVTAYYQSNYLNMLTWMTGTLCLAILHFHQGWQKNAIYSHGLMIDGKIIDWNEVSGYRWLNKQNRNDNHHDRTLIIILRKAKFLDLVSQPTVKVKNAEREQVDAVLSKYVKE